MSSILNLPKTSSQKLFDEAIKKKQQQTSPATTPIYTSPTGVTYIKDEKTQQSIPISSPASSSSSSSGRSSRSKTPTPRVEKPAIVEPKPSTTTSTIIKREPSGTIYISDPVRKQSVPIIPSTTRTTTPQTQTSPQTTIRGTTTERLPDGSSLLRPMTEEEQRKADKSASYVGRVKSTFINYFTDYESRVRLNEQYTQDVDTLFDFRPETVGTVLGAGTKLTKYILGSKLGAGLTTRGATTVSTIPANIKATRTAIQTARATGTTGRFLLESAKIQGKGISRAIIGSTATGYTTLEIGRAIRKEETEALKELSKDEDFNIREEFENIRKATEESMARGGKKAQEQWYQQTIKKAEEQGLEGEALPDYLRMSSKEYQQQTQFSAPWYKRTLFTLSGGSIFTGQDAFREQTRLRAEELNLTQEQTNIFKAGIEAERKSRGYAEIASAVFNTWNAEATGRMQNALTLRQFPVKVTSDKPIRALFEVSKRTSLPVAFASGQEALSTGVSERILRGETIQDIDLKELAQETAISFGLGGVLGSVRAGLTAQRTVKGDITKPAKKGGLLIDTFVYTADPYEIWGDFLEESRQQIARKVFKKPILTPVVEFVDEASQKTGRFRVRSIFKTPTTKTPETTTRTPSDISISPDGNIYVNDPIRQQSVPLFNFKFDTPRTETPRTDGFFTPSPKIESPKIPDPKISDVKVPNLKIPDVKVSDPRISDPRISDPKISDPRISDPRISDPRISDPKIPDPKIPDPKIPDPKIPDPRIPTLAFDWKMPPPILPPLSLPTGTGGAGAGFKGRKKFVSELEQSQKLLGNLLGTGFNPQQIKVKKEDKKKKRKRNAYDADYIFNQFFGGR